jgi:hypothetical protein
MKGSTARTMKLALVLVSGTLAFNGAQAQSAAQTNVMNHVAQVTAISLKCPKLKPNSAVIALLLGHYGIDLEREPYKRIMQAKGREHLGKIQKFETEIICVTGKTLYGPKGANVPDLLSE